MGILSLYVRIRVSENPYSRIFYLVPKVVFSENLLPIIGTKKTNYQQVMRMTVTVFAIIVGECSSNQGKKCKM